MRKLSFALLHKYALQFIGLSTVVFGVALVIAFPATALSGADSAPLGLQKPSVKEAATPTKPIVNSGKKAPSLPSPGTSPTRPLWAELTPAQQLALRPLIANWNELSEARKRKWLALSKNYPGMSSVEQTKLQSRMTEWVTLSAQQRTQARFNYAQAQAISPTEKQAKWQAYQALSAEEKRKLAVKEPAAPKGAAPATKPLAAQQLTVVPTSRQSVRPGQKIATATHKIDKNTLLPRPENTAAPDASAASSPEPAAAPQSLPQTN